MAAKPLQRWVIYVSEYESKHAEWWPHLASKMVLAFLPPLTNKTAVETAVSALFQALVYGQRDLGSSLRLASRDQYPTIEWNAVSRHCEVSAEGLPAIAATKSRVWSGTEPIRWEPQFWPAGVTAQQWHDRMRERGLRH